jgi:hypothetical protein
MRLAVTHEGVPIGVVDLEVDDHEGVGTLDPAPEKAAALTFELWDERGVYVPATVVRLVELKTRPGVTVFVAFGRTMSTLPARPPLRQGDAGGSRPQDREAS